MIAAIPAITTAPLPLPPAENTAWDWLIFAVVYFGVAVGTIPFTRLNRSAIALLGAIAVVGVQRMTFQTAVAAIDWATIALLFAMMVLAASLRVAGFYTRVIERIVAASHKPWTLLTAVILTSGALSALFANDIICLGFAPVLCVALQRAGRQPMPYLIALATSSNIGSAATIIGNPQNMLIGQAARLSFGHFTLVILPLVVLCLAINIVIVGWVYRRQLFGERPGERLELSGPTPGARPEPTLVDRTGYPPFRPWHVSKTLLITAGLVLTFLFVGVPREIAALVAAGLVLISRTQDPRKLFALVDWELILLFVGLFIVIGDVQKHGLLTGTLESIREAGISLYAPIPFSAVTLLLSNLVSNVPAVLLLKPGLPLPGSVGDHATYTWYLLAVVSTFAGNLTLLGSIANLIVAEQAKPYGVTVGFVEYLKTGVVLTLVTTALAVGYFVVLG